MPEYISRQLVLSAIRYNGTNLGPQWRITIDSDSASVIIDSKLKHRGSNKLEVPLFSRTLATDSTKPQPYSLSISAIEIDSKQNSDIGATVKPWPLDLSTLGAQEFELEVSGKGGAESRKRARLTFVFDVCEHPNTRLTLPALSSPSLSVTRSFATSAIDSDLLLMENASSQGDGGDVIGVKVTLIGIQNKGDSIGPDLSFDIDINNYGQGASFDQQLKKGAAATEVPVFSQIFPEGFDARLGVTIGILESDPKYDDQGQGGGFIDTYLEGIQTIEVPVAAEGGDSGRVAMFEFSFRVELIYGQTQEGGTSTTGGETTTGGGTTVGGTTTGPGPGTVTRPPEEPDVTPPEYPPPPPPPPECIAEIVGPSCTCIDGVYQYALASNCEGTVVDWLLEDEDGNASSVARIVYEDDKIARVLILDNGVFIIKAYFLFKGEEIAIEFSKEVDAVGVFHVLGGTTDVVTDTVPMVQPHPYVQIDQPKETADDCLAIGSDFLVHENKLHNAVALLHHSDPSRRINLKQLGLEHLEIQLKVSGIFEEFFREMNRCQWKSVSKGGRATGGGALRKNKDFFDASFETKTPGENNVKPHVVVLEGIGKHEVRIIGHNAIERPGSDWINVRIDLNEDAKKEVAERQRHMAELLSQTPSNPAQLAAHAQRITNTQIAIEQAYIRGLTNPCVTVKHNHQEAAVLSHPDGDKTRTQGRFSRPNGPDEIPAAVWTPVERHDDLVTKEERPLIYLNQEPVENYWVTKDSYSGTEYNWPDDGMMRGIVNETISSLFVCCDRGDVVFGVEAEVPDCAKLNSFNETILLKAKGDPAVSPRFNSVGQYRWKVIAKPTEDAQTEINPNTWTPANTAQLKVDTAGRYTVKVEYQLGRGSALTFAVADVLVVKNSDFTLQWQLKRAGGYAGELSEHVNLPLYQERKDEAIKAADMLITPVRPSGTAILVGGSPIPTGAGTAAPVDNTLGKQFNAAFLIPQELAFDQDIRVRVYFKPYSPSLGSDDYQDFVGDPAVGMIPGAEFQLLVDIETDKDIHAVHLLNIRYKHSQRFKGQAIPISFAYRLPEDEICPHSEDYIVEVDEGWRNDNPPLVNVITYNRDLGDAQVSNAYITLSNAGDHHSLCNGNVHFGLNLLETNGQGINQQLDIHYNSLQATYQDSLEFYRKLNGVSLDIIQRHWCRNVIGKGWTSSYHLTVRYYVVPLDINGRVKQAYAEVVAPDGNRIQFKHQQAASENGANSANNSNSTSAQSSVLDGDYRPTTGADFWLGSAEIGHSLVLTKNGNESVLSNINNTQWKFGKLGLLEEISEPLTRNTSTKALTVKHSASRTRITDSSGRQTSIDIIPQKQSDYSGVLKIILPEKEKINLTIGRSRLTHIDRSSLQTWGMAYHDDIGQGDTCSVLKALTDPLITQANYDYYQGDAYRGVPKEVARNFWGRLGKFDKGATQNRVMSWFYEGFNVDEQTVVFKNAVGIDFVQVLDAKRLALKSLSYVKKRRSTTSKELLSTPNYNPRKQHSDQLDKVLVTTYQYYEETKLLSETTDIYGEKTKRTYFKVDDGRYLLEEITFPDKTKTKMEYDSTSRLPNKIYTPRKGSGQTGSRAYTEYRYNANQQVTDVIHPSLRVASGSEITDVQERWVFDADGKLEEYYDVNNTKRSFAYGEDGRDPQGTQLPTSVTVAMDTNTQLISRTGYDKYGREILTYDPKFGTTTEFTYHTLGELEQEILQPIPTAAGREQGATIVNTYDAMMNHIAQTTPVGTELWIPNEHSEVWWHLDYLNQKTVTEYYASGAMASVTNPANGVTRFRYDEMGRVIRKHYPNPDNRTGVKRSERFTVLIDYRDSEKTIVAQRRKLNGNSLGDVVVENTDVLKDGKVHTQTTKTGAGPAFEKVLFQYDRWGQQKEVQWHDGDTLKKRLIQVRDDWGREIQQTHSDSNRRIKRSTFVSYYRDGRLKSRTHERIRGASGQPESHFHYDKLGRLLTVKDSSDRVLQQLVYGDFGNDPSGTGNAQIVELTRDPSAGVNQGGLLISRMYTYNRRALVILEDTDPNPNASLRTQKHYDVLGRLVKETQSDGTVLEFTLDALGRTETIEREAKVRDPSLSLHALRTQSDSSTTRRIKSVVQHTTYAWHGEIATQTQGHITSQFEYDNHGRLQQRSDQEDQGPQLVREQLTYDALDRVKRRETSGSAVQTYTYNDGERKVALNWRYSTTRFKATAELNWSGQITHYSVDQNVTGLGVSANYEDPKVALNYEYNDIGDLTSKIYLRAGDTSAYGRIDYRYNAAGVLHEQDVSITGLNGKTVKQERKYGFDANQHLTEIQSRNDIALRHNRWKTFSFHYNRAGFLKRLDRPYWNGRDTQYRTFGLRTLYDHDQRGRLTKLREGILPSRYDDLSIELHYARPTRHYIAGNYSVAEKDLSADQALKGVTYRKNYYRMTHVYAQDYMYDGLGAVETQVTSFTGHRGERKEDWRTRDVNPSDPRQVYSFRRFASASSGTASTSEYNYVQHMQFNHFGGMFHAAGRRTSTGPFDPEFGSPGASSPQGRKLNFAEERGLPAFGHSPTHSVFITENGQNDTTTPRPSAGEIHKGYRHNAADQLMGGSHQLLNRVESDNRFRSNTKNTGHSNKNYALYFYEPDGSLMAQMNVIDDYRAPNNLLVFVNDGGTLLAQQDLFTDRFMLHDTVPGVGVRLGTCLGKFADSDHDHYFWGEFYYHWNHNGAPTYLSDAVNRFIAADYRFATADNEADLFGENFNPGEEPHVLSRLFRHSRHGLNAWDFYHAAPMSVDMALAQVTNALDRNEHLLSMAADVSNPSRTVNQYGATLAPFGYPVEIPSYANLTYHAVLDLFRGIGDALTVGYASKWRNQIYDHDQDLAGIRNPMTYIAGQITGTIMSIYFAFAAVPLRAAQATWATRAAMLLTVTADIVTFAHSVQAIRSGKATFFDYLGLAAPLSVAGAIKIQHARNNKVINSIDKARNAIIEQIISKGDNLFHVILRPTTAMLSDAQIVHDLKKYFPVAEVLKKGRKTPVKSILGDEIPGSRLVLDKATYDALRKMGVTRRRRFKTVGQVDAVYRKIWRKLLKEAGDDLDQIAAGHRIDLGINRYQAAFEVRMFKWAMEGLVEGNPRVKQWLMDLFAKHGSSANSSVGSGVTKQLMNRLDAGSRITLEFLG